MVSPNQVSKLILQLQSGPGFLKPRNHNALFRSVYRFSSYEVNTSIKEWSVYSYVLVSENILIGQGVKCLSRFGISCQYTGHSA